MACSLAGRRRVRVLGLVCRFCGGVVVGGKRGEAREGRGDVCVRTMRA